MQSKTAILEPPSMQPPARPCFPLRPLSVREQEVLLGMWDCLGTAGIAERMRIKPSTVLEHKRRLFGKFNASSAIEVIRRAVEAKLLH